jgi:hypothetical protein
MRCVIRPRAAILSASLIVALSMSACGSGSPAETSKRGATAGRTTAVKTPLTEPVSPRVIARDRALGERALLRESDFSSEYAAAPRGGKEPPQEELATRLLMRAATCTRSEGGWTSYAPLNASVLAYKNPATVSGEVSEVGEPPRPKGNIGIESTITVEPTAAAAREWLSILEQPQLASCIGEAFRAHTIEESPALRKSGNSVGKAHVAKVAFPRYGDQTVAYRLIIPIVAEGHNLSVYYDYVLVRKGRADLMLTFTRLYVPVSSRMEQRLTALTVRRLRG